MTTELARIETIMAVELFKPGSIDPLLDAIKTEVRREAATLDISTETNRKAIASLAFKVAKSKTFVEAQRKALVIDETKRIAAINAEGRRIWNEFEALQEEVRKPLTNWENAEKERTAKHEENIAAMELAGTLDFGASIETIKERIEIVNMVDPSVFQEFKERATQTKTAVLSGLETKLKIAEKQAADALEMEKLRREAAERETRDREARIAQEAREKAQHEAEAERVRIEGEKYAAEARAKQAEAEKAAAIKKAEQDALDFQRVQVEAEKRHAEATRIAGEQAKAREEAAVEAEKARVAAEAKQSADETKAREKDKEHKAEVNSDALAAFQTAGLTHEAAKLAVTAIAKGLIPNVKISY